MAVYEQRRTTNTVLLDVPLAYGNEPATPVILRAKQATTGISGTKH